MKRAEKSPTSFFILVAGGVDRCCDSLFLSAGKVLAERQDALLGVYNWAGMANGRPFFTKPYYQGHLLYFFYKPEG